ncbi:MAG TPA: putative baseplate assembly protein [Vicinamibacterales bacterium]|nr:putative baseplate assembly protein [Vicinamibacterales bacterium]
MPAGTRVTAEGVPDEIPFETTNELVAIPGALQAMYAVDPAEDRVFRPPPDFLEQRPRTASALVYQVASFASAGSDRLQLDHVTDLKPGSFLRIDCREKAVVRKVDDGNIVTLEHALEADREPGAVVVPIQDFEVFNGIDVQEHVLYLGHSRILTVKSELLIRLAVDVLPRSSPALDLAWEFWTKDDTAVPPQDERWAPLTVVSDGTNGFSRSGAIVLGKPKDREIKPRKIDQRESRWIRARLRSPLTGAGPLPEIDAVAIGVESPSIDGEPVGIPADQGFYNATPLDVQVAPAIGFFPFGAEPRQFDQFYVASKEAFSKPGADVTLRFELDIQTLASPSAVLVAGTPPRVVAYAVGQRRRLYELDTANGAWTILGDPSQQPISGGSQPSRYLPTADAVPAAVVNETGSRTQIFVNTEDTFDRETPNRLWVLVRPANAAPTWVDLDAPPPPPSGQKQIKFDPAAIRLTDGTGFARVFVIAGDGQLYSKVVPDAGVGPAAWVPHGAPPDANVESSPFAVFEPTTQKTLVYVRASIGDEQFVYECRLDAVQPWVQLTGDVQPLSRPFARPFTLSGNAHAKVFVTGTRASDPRVRLHECDTSSQTAGIFDWVDLGQPDPAIEVAGDPSGYIDEPQNPVNSEGKHVFVRGANHRLYERLDNDGATAVWSPLSRPGDPDLRDAPAVAAAPAGSDGRARVDVLVASTRNSLVSWVFESCRGAVQPNVQGRAALLSLDTANGDHANKTLTVFDSSDTQIAQRTIAAYDEPARIARLDSPLLPAIDTTNSCEVDGDSKRPARADAGKVLAFHDAPSDGVSAAVVDFRLSGVVKTAVLYSRRTGLLEVGNLADATTNTPFALQTMLARATAENRPPEETDVVPELSWEYWNGRGWLSMPRTADATRSLLASGDVTFRAMPTVEATEVAGQSNFWIRVRLVGGDYGREIFRIVQDSNGNDVVVSDKSSLRPPKVAALSISYRAAPVPLEACQTFNNLTYLDQTAAAQLDGAHFPPFEPIAERSRSVFLGFERPFRTGPVRILLDAAERDVDRRALPAFRWAFRKDHEWRDLQADDESQALTRQGLLTLSAPDELTSETLFGQHLYWIRGSLRIDRGDSHLRYPNPLLRGVFPNTVWVTQGETVTDEIVGSSDGEPDQRLPLQHPNVLRELNRDELREEDIRVREAISVEEREELVRRFGSDAVIDREDIGGAWVRWQEVRAFFDAGATDRVYTVDRAAGIVRFGDGRHGAIPPADVDNIRAFRYRFGGGADGNVAAGEIKTLATAIQGIESVFNPTPAGGGSDTATTDAMLQAGPQQLSHRDRAVSPEDFEELAREATRQVAKAKCLAATNLVRATSQADPCHPAQRHQAQDARGWVSLIIVPKSTDPLPCPSLELRRTVLDYLRERAPSLVVAGDRLVVRPPDYVVVSVRATLMVASLQVASAVERAADDGLRTLLHPLTGGPEGEGWEFGRPVAASDVFAALERIADLDHVEDLQFVVGDRVHEGGVEIEPNQLIAGGRHVLTTRRIGS